MRSRHFVCLSVVLLLACAGGTVHADSSSLEKSPGLNAVNFQTSAGTVRVYLPDDTRAGDTISGTVSVEPAGATEAERGRNSGTLQGYVVELDTVKTPVRDRIVKWVVPVRFGKSATVVLRDAGGKVVSRLAVPVGPTTLGKGGGDLAPLEPLTPRGTGSGQPILPGPLNGPFTAASIGQSGRPFVIVGPFDGDAGSTLVRAGDAVVRPLAESPRQTVVEVPVEMIGMSLMSVSEPVASSGQPATGDVSFRALRIDLSAPKTSLLKGEKTELHVQVSGLDGITQPVPVRLVNESPSVVKLEGGETQTIVIDPGRTSGAGVFSADRTVTGSRRGGFAIDASVPVTMPATALAPTKQ
jgi:hypothetical protein